MTPQESARLARYCGAHAEACAEHGIDFGPFPGCRDCGRAPAEHEAFGQVYRWPFVAEAEGDGDGSGR